MYNLATICFMCLTENKCLKTLYNNDIENDAARQIKYLLPEIMLSELKISVHMCCACHTALQNFHSFKTRCMDNYYRLKNYLNTVKPTPTNPIKEIPPLPPKENNNEKKAPAPEPEKNNDITMEIEDDPLLLLERREHINLIEDSMDMNIKEELFDSEESDEQDNCQPIQFIKCEMPDDEPTNSNLPNIPPIKDYECSICEEKFVRHRDFRDHMNKNHADAPEEDNNSSLISLPEKSRRIYEKAYREFQMWGKSKKVEDYSESVLLAYFNQKATCCKASTLWSYYSMLKATMAIHNDIDIGKYTKLTAYLKRKNDGYKPQKSKILSREQIETFMLEAPDDTYLMMKVAVIFGIAGACRREELTQLIIDDIQYTGSALFVTIRESNRIFTVEESKGEPLNFLDIYRKYASLRDPKTSHRRFFVLYKNGRCFPQVVGKNSFGKIPKEIATYLKLPDAKLYTAHCFRSSSASLLADAAADIASVRFHAPRKAKVREIVTRF